MNEPLSHDRPVDEPLPPDAWRPPKFRGLCWLCGHPIGRPEILCDSCRPLGDEVEPGDCSCGYCRRVRADLQAEVGQGTLL